jgi:hypothetical protein
MSMPSLGGVLAGLPSPLRRALVREYEAAKRFYREGKWEEASLHAGKLCEITYRILQWRTSGSAGTYTPLGSTVAPFESACRNLANADKALYPESVRLTIPRMLTALYDIRNKRGVGHVGGAVDPSHMDATVAVSIADWLVAEVVRIFHSLPPAEAERLIEGLIARAVPIIWEVGDRRRILAGDLSARDQAMLLLYYSPTLGAMDADLLQDLEYGNPTRFRKEILAGLHRQRLVEYSKDGYVMLSPLGVRDVEDRLLPNVGS